MLHFAETKQTNIWKYICHLVNKRSNIFGSAILKNSLKMKEQNESNTFLQLTFRASLNTTDLH